MDAANRHRLKRWACAVALFLGASGAYSMPGSGCFDDKKLYQLIAAEGRGTLVYVWSPRMVYSVQQMAVAARAAAVHGLDFLPLHDALEPQSEPRVEQNSQLLCASVLLASEATRHFPTAFVVTNQGVHRFPIVGAMPPNAWLQSIGQRLQQP